MQTQDTVPLSRFFQAMDRLRRAWGGLEPAPQLNKSQFGTLMALQILGGPGGPPGPLQEGPCALAAEGSPVRLGVLAHAMGQSLPAISQRISALESLGCVERVNDPRDRRVSAVRLTRAGHALLEQGYANMKQKLSQAMEAIGPENLTLLLELLERMAAQLEKLAAADAGPVPGGAGRAEQEK